MNPRTSETGFCPSLGNANLQSRSGEKLLAGALWAKQPVVTLLLRRPGCVLCRYQAMELWNGVNHEAEKLGVKLVCICHEWLEKEVSAFSPDYWPGEVYFDPAKDFYKVLGQGKLLKCNSAASLLNPFSGVLTRIFTARKKVKTYNTIGVGNILGGVLVINSSVARESGKIVFSYVERDVGRPVSNNDVIAAVKEAATAQNA